MTTNAETGGGRASPWRLAPWAGAMLLLLLPLVAMRFTDEVAWDLADFVIFGLMLAVACGAFELAARARGDIAYRAAAGVALATVFLLVWVNLAVGLIGTEDDPANLTYGGVLAVGVVGAVIARFRPRGMARALVATALAQALVAVIALIAGWGVIVVPTAVFVALWLGSAWLFGKAAARTPMAAVS